MGAYSEGIARGPREAIQRWEVGNGEPSERGDSSALKKHGSYYWSASRKRNSRFYSQPDTKQEYTMLHDSEVGREYFLRNVGVLAQSFPNRWPACLLPFQPLFWNCRWWDEKLIKANFFFFFLNDETQYCDPLTWSMAAGTVLPGLWSPLSV